jgi:MerR family transcriptional regulator, light-induced transcriptional regulator
MTGEIYQQTGAAIDAGRDQIAELVTARHFELKPELAARYGAAGRVKCSQDAVYHLSYLSEALSLSQPSLFADYVAWAKTMLAGRGIPEKDLADNLLVLRDSLVENLPAEYASAASDYLDQALRRLAGGSVSASPPPAAAEPLAALAAAYLDALLRGRRDQASRLILEKVESGAAGIREIYLHVFQQTQHEIGRLWQTNRISVAQEHYCTAATQMIMSQLYPYIFSTERNGLTLVAACVSGDLHEIGVRMVSDFFEMEGWDTFYLGASTPAPALLQTIRERNADLVLLSATMTFHLRLVRDLIAAIRADERTNDVAVMVGGYPFNVAPDLWREIGADGFAADAAGAVETAARLVREDGRSG